MFGGQFDIKHLVDRAVSSGRDGNSEYNNFYIKCSVVITIFAEKIETFGHAGIASAGAMDFGGGISGRSGGVDDVSGVRDAFWDSRIRGSVFGVGGSGAVWDGGLFGGGMGWEGSAVGDVSGFGSIVLEARKEIGFGSGDGRFLLLEASVECDAIAVADAGSAEDIEGGANGEVDSALADVGDVFEVLEGSGTAGVGGREWGVVGEEGDEVKVRPLLLSFYIDGVD